MPLRLVYKFSIFLAIVIADLAFFIIVRQYFPEGYEWVIAGISYNANISVETARTLFMIGGFVIALICVPAMFYFIYNAVIKSQKSPNEGM